MYSRTTERIIRLAFGRAMVAIGPYVEVEKAARGDAVIQRLGEQADRMAGSVEEALRVSGGFLDAKGEKADHDGR